MADPNKFETLPTENRDSSVGIATGCGMDGRGVGVGTPVGSRIFDSPLRPDRLCGPPMGTGGPFPGGKAAEA
jgi:hypothetical protein